jgi:hypothetical protein
MIAVSKTLTLLSVVLVKGYTLKRISVGRGEGAGGTVGEYLAVNIQLFYNKDVVYRYVTEAVTWKFTEKDSRAVCW